MIAADGEQGITTALETVPDLIVSDVMMPHKDGFEVCHTLKSDERSSHIPIILLTAKADIQSRLTGLQRGADAYLSKPFHPEELLTRIQNLLDLRQKLQAYYLALTDANAGSSAPAPEPEDVLEHDFIQKVVALIQADYHKQWQVPELASRLYISDSQLHRKLEALTGKHTTEFVRFLRLKKAKQLLREQPEAKVSAIAYNVGFSNAQEFSRRFKELFGITPGAWQKMER